MEKQEKQKKGKWKNRKKIGKLKMISTISYSGIST